MSRYLLLVLDGEMKPKDVSRLGSDTSVHVEKGKSLININKLPRSDLEDVLRKIAASGVHRRDRSFNVGEMPKHKDPPGEKIAAFRLAPDDTGLPANPESDFEDSGPHFQRCSRLRENVVLDVIRIPEGHMAAVGLEQVVDQGLADWLREMNPEMVFGNVTWKGKKIPWRRILAVPASDILDKELAFNPEIPCRLCGKPIFPLRLTLIARKGILLADTQIVSNSPGFGHQRKELVILVGLEAAKLLKAKFRTGYILKPVYAADSQTAEYIIKVQTLLDKYLPPV